MLTSVLGCSEGFSSAPALAKKVVSLFELASDQLSTQPHYDFGMRALKAALVAAGVRKRAQLQADEAALLVQAMRDSNVPKFTLADVELFEGLVLVRHLPIPHFSGLGSLRRTADAVSESDGTRTR